MVISLTSDLSVSALFDITLTLITTLTPLLEFLDMNRNLSLFIALLNGLSKSPNKYKYLVRIYIYVYIKVQTIIYEQKLFGTIFLFHLSPFSENFHTCINVS